MASLVVRASAGDWLSGLARVHHRVVIASSMRRKFGARGRTSGPRSHGLGAWHSPEATAILSMAAMQGIAVTREAAAAGHVVTTGPSVVGFNDIPEAATRSR